MSTSSRSFESFEDAVRYAKEVRAGHRPLPSTLLPESFLREALERAEAPQATAWDLDHVDALDMVCERCESFAVKASTLLATAVAERGAESLRRELRGGLTSKWVDDL